MNYSFHPEAEIEFNQAVEYYETCQAGLGLAFAKEIFRRFSEFWHIHMHGPTCQRTPDDALQTVSRLG